MRKLVDRRDFKEELRIHLAAQRELGPGMEDAAAAAFMERIDREIDARVEAKLAHHLDRMKRERRGATMTLVVTMVMAFPLSLVAASAGLPGLALVWASILLLNYYRR